LYVRTAISAGYNEALRITPGLAQGFADHVWQLVKACLDNAPDEPRKRPLKPFGGPGNSGGIVKLDTIDKTGNSPILALDTAGPSAMHGSAFFLSVPP
jgi:hypothetical protein